MVIGMSKWEGMSVKELKAELKSRKITQNGNKKELIEKLEDSEIIDAKIVNDNLSEGVKNKIYQGFVILRNTPVPTLGIIAILLIGTSGGAFLYSDEIMEFIGEDVEYTLIDFDIEQTKSYTQTLVNLGHPEWEGRLSGTIEEKNTADSIKYNFSEMGIPSTLEEFSVPMFVMGNQFELSTCKPGDVGDILGGISPCSLADANREITEFEHREDYVIQGYSGFTDIRYADYVEIVDLNRGSSEESWSSASEKIGLVWIREGGDDIPATESNTILFKRAQENQLLALILVNDKTNCAGLIEGDCVPYFKSLDVESFGNLPENIGLMMVSKSTGEYLLSEVINGESRIQLIIDVQNQGKETIYVPCGIIEGESEELIIFGAHHDTVYNGQGAVDNTAGAATVQEIARQFGLILESEGKPEHTIWFCTWGGEEEGLWGSREWVQKHKANLNENLRIYINLDMNHVDLERNTGITIFGNNKKDITEINNIIKEFGKQYSSLYEKYPINVRYIESSEMPNNSDFAPFLNEIDENEFGNVVSCYGSGSSEYHTYLDTMERFNEESLAVSGIIYGSFAYHLAY
ncbi:MAG: M28 family peptidase [Candidatus Thalassarchaeaceae archaeon]